MPRIQRFLDRDRFLVGVDHHQNIRQAAHFLDAAEAALKLFELAVELQQLLLGQAGALAGLKLLFERAQPADRIGDRLPIGQRAAEPAMVDVMLAAALGGGGHRPRGLALGADEQHPAARGRDVADGLQRLIEHRHRLGQVDDVDAVPLAEQIRRHLRIPTMGLVAEMNAGFQKLAHADRRQGHVPVNSFSG